MSSTHTLLEPAREVEIVDDVDVLVVGGGPAGVCAAVASAREGARTFLLERHGFLGGMWTAGMVLTLAGFNSWLRPYTRCVEGVAGEWIRRATVLGGGEDNESWVLNSDPEAMKLVADQLIAEAGVSVLLHTWGARPIMEGRQLRGAFLENVDGRRAVLARVTIDCTGNGDLIARSGAQWEKSDSLQPMTMAFRLVGAHLDPTIDIAEPVRIPIGPEPGLLREPLLSEYASRRHDVPCERVAMRAARDRGEIPNFGGPWFGGLEKDVVWVNATRVYGDASVASDLTRAEIQGRRDAHRLTDYFRAHVPGLEDARILHTGTQIGVRETRRLVGEYTLTADDIREGTDFPDAVAVGCWPIDVHPAPGEVGVHAMYVPSPYGIPYRTVLPQATGNLLAAGRCMSATREALGSTRVGATCAALGQAAGVAAALSARAGVDPHALDPERLRAALRAQEAIVDPPALLAGVEP